MSIDKASAAQIKPPRDRKKRPPKKITPDYLHNAGLYYLQRFAASAAHFRAVMLRKVKKSCHSHKDQDYESCAAMVEELVKKFQNAGLLDDAAYTGAVVISSRRRGLSRRAIIARLQNKGIESAQAGKTLAAHDLENYGGDLQAEHVAALSCARKRKIGPFATKKTEEEKELAALGRRGFSYDTARFVLGLTKTEAESLLKNPNTTMSS